MTRHATPLAATNGGRIRYRDLLWRYLSPLLGSVALMAVLLLAGISLELLGPRIASLFIQSALGGGTEAALLGIAVLFIVVAIAQQAAMVLATYASQRVAWIATNELRADLTAHLLHLDLTFHESRSPGELIERVDGDVNLLAEFFSGFFVQLVGNGVLLLGVLVALALLDLRLGLAFALLSLLGIAVLSRVRSMGTARWVPDREQSALFYGDIGETLRATEDVKSSGAVAYVMQRLFQRRRGWLPIALRAVLWAGSVWMVATVVTAAGTALAFWLGGRLYFAGSLTVSSAYLVVAYAAMLEGPIDTIRTQLQEFQQSAAAILRVSELFALRSRLRDGHLEVPSGPLSVELRRVSFSYGTTQVLHDVELTVPPGGTLAIIGRTGAGKTTIARLLFRLYDVPQGEVRVGGLDVRDARMGSLRSRVGLVTQDVQLFDASLRDNITFFDESISDERAIEVLGSLGLGGWLASLPAGLDTRVSASSLSAGEAQLVALARVFLKDPGLVILDEPSSRVDPATEDLLEAALDHMLQGRTAIVIAHRMKTIRRASDVCVLEAGRVIERGRAGTLLAETSRLSALAQSLEVTT
jgi:ATP-binding cassette, subfamily B, bacterial